MEADREDQYLAYMRALIDTNIALVLVQIVGRENEALEIVQGIQREREVQASKEAAQ